jgi:hypothetical protein
VPTRSAGAPVAGTGAKMLAFDMTTPLFPSNDKEWRMSIKNPTHLGGARLLRSSNPSKSGDSPPCIKRNSRPCGLLRLPIFAKSDPPQEMTNPRALEGPGDHEARGIGMGLMVHKQCSGQVQALAVAMPVRK